MCVVCWRELDWETEAPVQLTCCHAAVCTACRASLTSCPLCAASVGPLSAKSGAVKALWSTPRRRHHSGELEDVVDDDHAWPTALGERDLALPPRLRMLERAPSSADATPPARSPHTVAVSARHIVHAGAVVSRTVLRGALLPAARVSCRAGHAALSATCLAAAHTGRAIAGVTCSFVRFATAPRAAIIGYDGGDAVAPFSPRSIGRTYGGRGRQRFCHQGGAPEPLSNLVGARVTLADCRFTRLRIEYCSDCVVVATRLEAVELLLVGCQRIKLVLRGCRQLLLRELQCCSMGDMIRKDCPDFAHEIVCLRCACKPHGSPAGAYC